MTEREKLLVKSERFLNSARILAENGDLDSAISRVYYAAFFVAEALLDAKGLSFSSHRGVISAFGQYFSKTSELDSAFHRLLINTFEKRQMGDYLSETSFSISEIQELICQAYSFLSIAKEWLQKH